MKRLLFIALFCLNSFLGADGRSMTPMPPIINPSLKSPKRAAAIATDGKAMTKVSNVIVPPIHKTFTLSWNYPPRPNTEFVVLTQSISQLPQPKYVFDGKRWNLVCDIVTTVWFTNGWSVAGITNAKSFTITNAQDSGVLHGYSVFARDTQTLFYSNLATK